MNTERNYAPEGETTTLSTVTAPTAAQPTSTADERQELALLSLTYELSDWLTGDMAQIREAKGFIRDWFMAYLQTDLCDEMGREHKARMTWFYAMLDIFLEDCMEQEALRVQKGGSPS